jgi:hypothetical protein
MKNYELFFDAAIYGDGHLKMPASVNRFYDHLQKSLINRGAHLKIPASGNQFTEMDVLRRLPSLIDDFRRRLRRQLLGVPASEND